MSDYSPLESSGGTDLRRGSRRAEHIARLVAGVEEWNRWRAAEPDCSPDLIGSNLNDANLAGANLAGAKLNGADLIGAKLNGASLIGADLSAADVKDLAGVDVKRA